MGKFNDLFPLQILDNQRLITLKERRFMYALREIVRLNSASPKWVYHGFILATHGFVFEHTEDGWIRQPENYLHDAEVIKRFPKKWQRRAFYEKRQQENRFYHRHKVQEWEC